MKESVSMEYKYSPHLKPYELIREHFIERLLLRYGLIISEPEFDVLADKFKGVYKKTFHKTIGYVLINEVKVWCLYFLDTKVLSTAYPKEIDTDNIQLITACFSRSMRHLAIHIYELYLKENELIVKRFESEKDAAIWYFANTLFPTLHIETYKHGSVSNFKIMRQIQNVLDNNSRHIEISLKKK